MNPQVNSPSVDDNNTPMRQYKGRQFRSPRHDAQIFEEYDQTNVNRPRMVSPPIRVRSILRAVEDSRYLSPRSWRKVVAINVMQSVGY